MGFLKKNFSFSFYILLLILFVCLPFSLFVFSHEKRSLKLFYLAGFFPLCRQIYRIPGGTFFPGRTFSRFREIGRCKGKVLLNVTLTKYIGPPRSSSTKADERQSQNICEI